MTDLSQIEELAKSFVQQNAEMKASLLEIEQKMARRPRDGGDVEQKGLKAVSKIVESDQIKAYRDNQSSSVTSSADFEVKALTNAGLGVDGSTEYPTQAQRNQNPIIHLAKPTSILDVLPVIPATSSTYEYVRLASTYEDSADYQAEEGAQKSNQEIPCEAKTVTHRTIAVTTTVSNQVAADNVQLQTTIETLLKGGVRQKLEREVVQGDGTGTKIEGFAYHADLFEFDNTGATSFVDAIGEARAQAKEAGLNPSVVIINPVTLQSMISAKNLSGDYILGGDGLPGMEDMWTLRIVEAASCARGEAFILDMEQIALLDREQLTVKIDDITLMDQNLTRIRVELRASFANFIKGAIIKVKAKAAAGG